ncbi:unnamed protein product [Staurois parvus]|uniref:Uncharacterized protein n=1 Tax=Staurois parvus TaxID=386267 RepID=A0ABN9GN43_9NEOB|nr:unnamed protein product [Staurois parvus]
MKQNNCLLCLKNILVSPSFGCTFHSSLYIHILIHIRAD